MSSIEITNRKLLSMNSKLKVIEVDVDNVRGETEHTNINALCKIDKRLENIKKKYATVYNALFNQVNKMKEHIDSLNKSIRILENREDLPIENNLTIIKNNNLTTEDPLYVILPYFNYCSFNKRTTLFVDFIERYKKTAGIRIIVIEGILENMSAQLPQFEKGVFMHLKVELTDRIWIKENLINIAVKQLPISWKYMAWIDADITFFNENWVKESIEKLQTNDMIQMFHSAVNMGPSGESLKVEQGFVYMYKKSGQTFRKTSKYGVWHPGFAWACTREAYNKMKTLLDIGIMGSADRHMSLALINKADFSYPGNIGLSYQEKVLEKQELMKDFKFDYVNGTILHHFHGSIKNRKYVDRWKILTENQYNVKNDVYYNTNGILSLTEKGKRIQPDMDEYFLGRDEDATTV